MIGAGLVGLSVTALILGGARDTVARLFREHREARALDQAQSFIAKKDLGRAFLALEVAVQANPDNPTAWRIAAETLETAGSRQAISVRQQILNTQPDLLASQLALAGTALRFQDLPTAEAALALVAPAHRGEAEVLKLRAGLVYAQGHTDEAETALDALLLLEPDNEPMRLNRALIRLRHANSFIAEEARTRLASLAASSSPSHLAALRELTRDAAVRQRPDDALKWSRQLAALPDATFDDQLLLLNVLAAVRPDEAPAAERALGLRAGKQPAEAGAFATRLMVQGRAQEAATWLESLPPAIRSAQPLPAVTAECRASLGEWDAFSALLQAGAWGAVPEEPIKLAFSAHLLASRQRAELSRSVWGEALTAAKADPAALRILLRLALYWKWPAQADEALLMVARNFPNETWALNALVSSAYAHKDTAMLKNAYSLWHAAQPANRRVAGDWAMLSLLLEPGAADTEARRVAATLHDVEPHNPFFGTTEAFALYQKDDVHGALAIMEHLLPADLGVPGRALYYGLFLAADGQLMRAEIALKLADQADLLPPEQTLLRRAWALVHAPGGSPKPASL